MAASTAGGVQPEVDKQLNMTPVQPAVPPEAAVPATGTARDVAIDSKLPALSDRRSSTPLTPSAHTVPRQEPPEVATPTIAANRPTVPTTAETRPTAQAGAGQPPTGPTPTRHALPSRATPQNPAPQRMPLPSAPGGHPSGFGALIPTSSLLKDVVVPGKTRLPANSGTVTPVHTPHAPPTPPVSAISNVPPTLPPKQTVSTVSPPTAQPPKPTATGVPSPAPTASPTPVSFAKNGSALPISSLLTSPAPQPAGDSQAGPRPAYKMKRTGRPGMLPPNAMHPNGSKTPTSSGSTPTRTPTDTPPTAVRDNFGIKTQPPPQPQSRLFAQTSPKPALIESDLLPTASNSPLRSTESLPPTTFSYGPPNGIKRRRESSAVELAHSPQKRAKSIRSSSSSDDVVEAPVTLAISLLSGPDEFSESDDSTDSSDSSDGDIEDTNGLTNVVAIEEDNDISGLDDAAISDDGLPDDDDDSGGDEATDSIDVGDDEAAAIPSFASSDSYTHAPSGRAYNKYEGNVLKLLGLTVVSWLTLSLDKSGESIPTLGALLPDGYKLWPDRLTPWICPIRSCRKLFPELSSMGRHFSVRCGAVYGVYLFLPLS